jgi:hypothetical protein
MAKYLGEWGWRVVQGSSVHAFVQKPLDEPRAQVTSASYPAYDRSKAAGEAELRNVVMVW